MTTTQPVPTGAPTQPLTQDEQIDQLGRYKYGWADADVAGASARRGIDEDVVRDISARKGEPEWMLERRLKALKLFGREVVYVSDEVYGSATAPGHGCPWGWARTIDISRPAAPSVQGEYKLEQNFVENCRLWEPRPRTSYSAHNPTATPSIVFTTWHSGGVQAISVADPTNPYQLAEFLPAPLPQVAIEDPRLSADPDTGNGEKVVMWSYPIIRNGLIYVVDLRNGLYVLDYDGPSDAEVSQVTFLEGNSNLGHALCFEPVGNVPDDCDARSATALLDAALGLLAGMDLRPQVARPLEGDLLRALRAVERGRDAAGCRALGRFAERVDAYEDQGPRRGVSPRQATALRNAAEAVQSALDCPA